MKRIPEHDPDSESANRRATNRSQELDGLRGLGMKRETLRLARRTLKETMITPESFNAALNAILTLADRLKPWAALVESAYARLQNGRQKSANSWMLSFHCCNHNYEAASRFIPRRFGGVEFSELGFAMEAALAVGERELVEKLAKRLSHLVRMAEDPVTQAQLLDLLAEYHTRKGDWNKAIELWEIVQLHETFSQSAVISIVEIQAARALRAIQHGFQLIEKFNKNFDPESETILPGNDKAVQQEAAKRFRRLQKILERIVPKERQMELGISKT